MKANAKNKSPSVQEQLARVDRRQRVLDLYFFVAVALGLLVFGISYLVTSLRPVP